ncbi:MAG: UDP-N-acetylmuramate dehydrogenase [Eggerthellaceae bacterium]|jgi:UDP-N-acetylmuramate dehydrogenase
MTGSPPNSPQEPREAAVEHDVPLAQLTTFHIGGPARELVTAYSEAQMIEAVRESDEQGMPVLVIGGGSNILCADKGFAGRVVRDGRTEPLRIETGTDGEILFTAPAGMVWDDAVAYALDRGYAGMEALSGIPGTVGAAPIQNVGAYGHEMDEIITCIRVYDRRTEAIEERPYRDFHPAYRDSDLKRSTRDARIAEGDPFTPTGRWIVTAVTFRLQKSADSLPVQYAELAKRLGVEVGEAASAQAVRQTVLDLRRSKGMVTDEDDHDTWSAGSFFTNPILAPEDACQLPDGVPRYPTDEGTVKTSAAWLIQHSGLPKGSAATGDPDDDATAPATLSTKHVLALTNRGNASAADVLALAKRVQAQVKAAYGITLAPEPIMVGMDSPHPLG